MTTRADEVLRQHGAKAVGCCDDMGDKLAAAALESLLAEVPDAE